MANICINHISITGDVKKVAKVIAFWKKELVKDYNKINHLTDLSVYTPEEKKKKDIHKYVGCRWIDEVYIEERIIKDAYIKCASAWTPPNPLLKRIAETFDVKIINKYYEPEHDFGGQFKCTKKTAKDDCLSYTEYINKYEMKANKRGKISFN